MFRKWLVYVFCSTTFSLTFAEVSTEVIVPADAYKELTMTEQQEGDVRKLIKILANTNTMGLMFKKGELEKIGRRTYGIHPLRYLGYIYADPELKICMPKLLAKSIVASRFTKEIAEGLNERLDKGQLLTYIPGFAASLHLETSTVMTFVEARDWKGMLTFLNGTP